MHTHVNAEAPGCRSKGQERRGYEGDCRHIAWDRERSPKKHYVGSDASVRTRWPSFPRGAISPEVGLRLTAMAAALLVPPFPTSAAQYFSQLNCGLAQASDVILIAITCTSCPRGLGLLVLLFVRGLPYPYLTSSFCNLTATEDLDSLRAMV